MALAALALSILYKSFFFYCFLYLLNVALMLIEMVFQLAYGHVCVYIYSHYEAPFRGQLASHTETEREMGREREREKTKHSTRQKA